MAAKVSNPRDLVVLLLGELLFVERRLAGQVLRELADAVTDSELRGTLLAHLDETKAHVERIETAFLRLAVTPTANLSQAFESAVSQQDDLATAVVESRLGDLFHAQAALHTEHWELASYQTILALAPAAVVEPLRPSYDEERRTAARLVETIDRLAAE